MYMVCMIKTERHQAEEFEQYNAFVEGVKAEVKAEIEAVIGDMEAIE